MSIFRYGKNVARSTAYAIPAIIKNRLPGVDNLVSQFTDSGRRETIASVLSETRSILKEDIRKLLGTGVSNATKELKSGKLHQTEEEVNASFDAAMGMDGDMFDNSFLDGEESDSSSNYETAAIAGNAAASGAAHGVAAAAARISDSPSMRASAEAGISTAKFSRANLGAQIVVGNAIRGAVLANAHVLGLIHKFQTDHQQDFYRKQIEHNAAMSTMTSEMLTRISELKEVSRVAAAATDQVMQSITGRTNDFSDVFGGDGFDASSYLSVINRRIRTAVGEGSMFKTMGSAVAAAPLSIAFREALASLIPQNFGKQLDQFNQFMSDFGIMLNERMGAVANFLRGRGGFTGVMGSKILDFFTIKQESSQHTPNLSNIVRGKAVAFDGYAHRSIVEVIPSLLSDIHSEIVAMRKSKGIKDPGDRKLYDFNSGRFVSEKQLRSNFEASAERSSMSHFDRVRRNIGDDGDPKTAREVAEALKILRNERYSIKRGSADDFTTQYDEKIASLRTNGSNKQAEALEKARERIINMRKTGGARAAAELQTAIVKSGEAKSRMYSSIETTEGAQRMMYSGQIYDPETMQINGKLDIDANGTRKGRGKRRKKAVKDDTSNREGIIYATGSPEPFERGAADKNIFTDENGNVTLRSIMRAPMVGVSKAILAFETSVSTLFFGSSSEKGDRRGIFGSIKHMLMGDIDPETGKRSGPLGKVFDYVKFNVFNPLKKAIVGDPSDPSSVDKSIVGITKRWFSETVTAGKSFLFGKAVFNDGKMEREGGLFGGIVNWFSGKSAQLKNALLGKGEDGGKQGLLLQIKEKFDGLVNRLQKSIFGSIGEDGRRSGGMIGDGIQKGKDLVSSLWDRFQDFAIKPLQQSLFGNVGADGKRSGGIFGSGIQKGKDFMSRLWETTSESVLKPIKDSFLGKAGPDGTRVGGILGTLKDAFRTSLVEPIAEGLLGKRNADGVREGGALKVISSSMKAAFAPLKETFVGENGIFTNIRKGLSDTWSDLKKSFFGDKEGENDKPLLERIGDKFSGLIERFGGWLQERLKPVTDGIKKAGEWLSSRVFEPFNKWMNDPKTGFITRMREGTANFFYGKKGEDGVREGGLFGSIQKGITRFFYGDENQPGFVQRVVEPAKKFVLEEVWTPLKNGMTEMWTETKTFFKSEIMAPLKGVFEPFVTEAKEQWRLLKEWTKGPLVDTFKSVGNIINDSFKNTLGKSLTEMLRENVLNPIKDVLGGVKTFFMTTLKGVMKLPVNILKGVSDDLAINQIKRGIFKGSAAERERLIGKAGLDGSKLPAGSGSSLNKSASTPSAAIGSKLATPIALNSEERGIGSRISGGLNGSNREAVNAAGVQNNSSSAAIGSKITATPGGGGRQAVSGIPPGATMPSSGGREKKSESSSTTIRSVSAEEQASAAVSTADNTHNMYQFMRRHMSGLGHNVERLVRHFKVKDFAGGGDGRRERFGLMRILTSPLSFAKSVIVNTLKSATKVVTETFKAAYNAAMIPIRLFGKALTATTKVIGYTAKAIAPLAGIVKDVLVGTIGAAAKIAGVALRETAKGVGTLLTTFARAIPAVTDALAKTAVAFIKVSGSLLYQAARITGAIGLALAKITATVAVKAAQVAKDVITTLASVTFNAIGSLFNTITGRGKEKAKSKVMPVYVVGGRLADIRGGAKSLAEARTVGDNASIVKRLAAGAIGGTIGTLGGPVGSVVGGMFGFMNPNAILGGNSFSRHTAKKEAAAEKKEEKGWRNILAVTSAKTASATTSLSKGFGTIGKMLMMAVPALMTAMTGIATFFMKGKFVSILMSAIGMLAGRSNTSVPNNGTNNGTSNGTRRKPGRKPSGKFRMAPRFGLGGLVAGTARDVLGTANEDGSFSASDTALAMAEYGSYGAAIGSVIPGLGTAVGAGVGALAGGVVANWGLIKEKFSSRAFGGPMGSKATMVGELGPEVLDQNGNVISGIKSSSPFSNPELVKAASEREDGVNSLLKTIANNTAYMARYSESINLAVGGPEVKKDADNFFKLGATVLKKGIQTGIAGILSKATGFGITASGVVSAISDTVGNIKNTVVDGAKGLFSNTVSTVRNVGSSLAQGNFREAIGHVGTGAKSSYNIVKATGSTLKGNFSDGASAIRSGNGAANIGVLVKSMQENGMTDPKEQAMFLAQLDHESGGFKRLSENLRYQPQNLLKTFPKYFRTLNDAQEVAAAGPEAIAERVYGGRMGNSKPGDGFKYRGRGFIQLTGYDNYAAASKALGIDLVNNPDQASQPEIAAKIAHWYWQQRGISTAARNGDIEKVTKRINGGFNGIEDRRNKFAKYMREVPSLMVGTGSSEGTPIKSAMRGGWMSSIPTLVGEMQPEVLTPDGRIHKDVSSFINGARTSDISSLAMSTAIKEAERRATSGSNATTNEAFSKLAEAVTNKSDSQSSVSVQIMQEIIGVLREIAGNTANIGKSSDSTVINASRGNNSNIFVGSGGKDNTGSVISGMTPAMRAMMTGG